LHVTSKFDDPAANRSVDELIGNFIALRTTYPPTGELCPDWRMDNFRVYVRTPPALPKLTLHSQDQQVQLEIAGSSRGFRYLLERSTDLLSWMTVLDYVSNGGVVERSEPAVGRMFYRVTRP
jgi:hypothetical protein